MDMPDFITIVKDKLEAEFEDVDNVMLIRIISISQLAIISYVECLCRNWPWLDDCAGFSYSAL